MNDNETTNETDAETIVTARITKSGGRVKRKVAIGKTVLLEMHPFAREQLRKHLAQNHRVVFFDPETEDEICDFYNWTRKDGKLVVCARTLNPWKEKFHETSGAKVALKYRGGIVGEETLARLNREAKQYRSVRRQRVVPRRIINAECPQCGNIFEVELGGLTND